MSSSRISSTSVVSCGASKAEPRALASGADSPSLTVGALMRARSLLFLAAEHLGGERVVRLRPTLVVLAGDQLGARLQLGAAEHLDQLGHVAVGQADADLDRPDELAV